MNVALGADYTVVKLDLAGGADKLTYVCSLGIARLADKCVNADGAGVGKGNLNLGLGTYGSQNGNALKLSLGADNGNSLFAGKLAGLRKILFGGQLISLAEEGFEILFGHVDMAGGCFNKNGF